MKLKDLKGFFIFLLLLTGLVGLASGQVTSLVKRLIAVQDINFATGGMGAAETWTYTTAGNQTLTLTKPDASHLKFQTAQSGGVGSVENLVDGSYKVDLFPNSMTTSGALNIGGTSTFTGLATFSQIPELPAVDPTTNNQATRKVYVDTAIAAAQAGSWGVDAGGTDDYAITTTPAIAGYTTGQTFSFKANTANTGAATLNVCSKGQITIKKYVAGAKKDLQTGDIEAGQIQTVLYDGTDFVTMSSKNRGYLVACPSAAVSPADATTYYYAGMGNISVTLGIAHKIYLTKSGTVTRIIVNFNNSGPVGTAETSSIYIRLNNTTDTLISNAVVNNAADTQVSNLSMSVQVVAGDYISLKWITPTWATNPGTVLISASIFIE